MIKVSIVMYDVTPSFISVQLVMFSHFYHVFFLPSSANCFIPFSLTQTGDVIPISGGTR